MQNHALMAIRALYSTLYPDESSVSIPHAAADGEDTPMTDRPSEVGAIEGVAVKMVQNSLEELGEPDKNNAKPAARILTALISSSSMCLYSLRTARGMTESVSADRLARYVLQQSLPLVLDMYKNQDDIALRPSLLSHLATLLASLSEPDLVSADPDEPPPPRELSVPPTFRHDDGQSPLEPHRDDLLSILTGSTRALTCRLPALAGLLALVRVPEFLTPSEVDFSISSINEVLTSPDGDEYYDAALDALVVLARRHPQAIERLTLPLLLATLPTSPLPMPGSAESDEYRRALEALAALCVPPDLFEILALRLSARLDESLAFIATPSSAEYIAAALYSHHLLATLRAVVQEKVKQGHVDVPKYAEGFAPRLCSMFILPTTFNEYADGSRSVALDPRLVLDAGRVVNLVVQRVDPE